MCVFVSALMSSPKGGWGGARKSSLLFMITVIDQHKWQDQDWESLMIGFSGPQVACADAVPSVSHEKSVELYGDLRTGLGQCHRRSVCIAQRMSPWYDLCGWLGVKKQLSIYRKNDDNDDDDVDL